MQCLHRASVRCTHATVLAEEGMPHEGLQSRRNTMRCSGGVLLGMRADRVDDGVLRRQFLIADPLGLLRHVGILVGEPGILVALVTVAATFATAFAHNFSSDE